MTDTQTADAGARPGVELVRGKPYMLNGKGNLVPVELIGPRDLLMDETVRKIMAFAAQLNEQISRFKQHTMGDVADFQALLAQDFAATVGGEKGNITLTSFDGLLKVQVAVQDRIEFGPELVTAKSLIDECLNDWGSNSHPALRAIIQRAFNVDQAGRVSPADLFSLLRHDIDDERWQRGMEAIRASIRPIGTKEYVRFYRRASHKARWEAVTIDVAAS